MSAQCEFPSAFRVAPIAAPATAARFLASVELDSPAMASFVVGQLWVVAHYEDMPERGSELAKAVNGAADTILNRIMDSSLRTWLLIVRLEIEP